jgi:hypothetical protein
MHGAESLMRSWVRQLVNKFSFYGTPKFHHRVHKSPQLGPILSEMISSPHLPTQIPYDPL